MKATYIYSLVIASTVSYAKLCSPHTCIQGLSKSPLVAHGLNSVDLTPGTYPISDYTSSELQLRNTTLASVAKSYTISLPVSPVLFNKKAYHDLVPTDDGDWSSAYLPDGWYGTLAAGQAVWGAIPDKSQLRNGPPQTRGFVEVAYDRCDPVCGYGGTCLQGNTSSTCQCREGWGGQTCDQCATGHYGSDCQPCSDDCTHCDEGLAGTGVCLGTKTDALKQCGCLHGTCTSSGDCTCAAGWQTTSNSPNKCNACASGFFQTKSADCLACPLGCSECTLHEGTDSTPSCTGCSSTLTLSTSNPAICVSRQSCPNGLFWNPDSSSCDSCSPACATCTGSSPSQCLSCAAPRVNLAGSCVGYASSSGICDSSLSGLSGVFVINNEKSKCDACPAGCTTCSIPSYSPSSAYSTVMCSACQDGYLLQSGQCVKTCSEGFFLPPDTAERNGTCQRCDDSCKACIDSPTTCTRCSEGLFASNGHCTPACPYRTSGTNGTCLPCSPTCGTCTSPLDPAACTSCPPDRPVLHNNQCSDHCPKSMWFDGTTCQRCDSQCSSCIGASSSCSSCPDGHVLKGGKCQEVTCDYVSGLGVCIGDLVTSSGKKWLPFIIIPLALLVIGAGLLWWYRRKQQRKRRAEVKQFGDAMDQVRARDGDTVPMRLERILGLNRVRIRAQSRQEQEREQDEEGRYKLREFLLPRHRDTKAKNKALAIETGAPNTSASETIDLRSDSDLKSDDTEMNKKGKRATNRWSNPPPPYAHHSRSSVTSISTIGTLDLPKRGEIRLLSPSKITSMASPTASSFFNLDTMESTPTGLGSAGAGVGSGMGAGLKPPPRHRAPADEYNQKPTIRYSGVGTGVDTGTGTGSGSGAVGPGQLNELWPARKIEGWI